MKSTDKTKFVELIQSTMASYNFDIKPAAVGIWWACMERYEFDAVRQALAEHIQDPERGQFFPKPADVIRVLQANDGWIGVEEAWAIMAPALNDERVTVVATQEMLTAFGVALHLQDDSIAARMAFKEKYETLVARARKQGNVPKWTPSLGYDPIGREGPLLEAQRLGRLPAPQVAGLLGGPLDTVRQLPTIQSVSLIP